MLKGAAVVGSAPLVEKQSPPHLLAGRRAQHPELSAHLRAAAHVGRARRTLEHMTEHLVGERVQGPPRRTLPRDRTALVRSRLSEDALELVVEVAVAVARCSVHTTLRRQPRCVGVHAPAVRHDRRCDQARAAIAARDGRPIRARASHPPYPCPCVTPCLMLAPRVLSQCECEG